MSPKPERQPAPDRHATPLYVKREADFAWPQEPRMFYLLAREGLFQCRNHEFFRSCVPARQGPADLVAQSPFMEVGFPLIPRELFERVVGFFDRIAKLHNSEASVLLAFDRETASVQIVVPEQTATVYRYADGYQSPIGLFYYPPLDLPQHWVVFGDIHSHVNMAAYSSGTDVHDETHSAGLHVVVGRLYQEPVDIHVEAVVDGERFQLELEDVVEGYEARSQDVPQEWIDKLSIEASTGWSSTTSSSTSSGTWSASGWNDSPALDEGPS